MREDFEMIYLSGALKAEQIGKRKDIGLLLGFREKKDFFGKTNKLHEVFWAADNGCFTNPNLNVADYLVWLKKMSKWKETALFATAPDVVADADATFERSKDVLPKIRELDFPAAFVAQDGIENKTIHWDTFDVLFIGGTTEWKTSDASFWLIKEAKRKGKFVHVGRVNSLTRLLWARLAGATSADGTYIAFAPDKNYRNLTRWLDVIKTQPAMEF